MDDVTIDQAKEQLEELVARAARGEDVTIEHPQLGKVKLARVKPEHQPNAEGEASHPRPERKPGRLKGILPPPPDDFFDPLSEEELKDWYGDSD